MRFSKWHALGNSYLVVERGEAGRALAPADARRLCSVDVGIGAHGVLEVVGVEAAAVEIAIWNPDGSLAEMSGNGTRIAAAWLGRRTGAREVAVRVGPLTVESRLRPDGLVEQRFARVEVGSAERIEAGGESLETVVVDVGNPHAVIVGGGTTRERLLRLGPLLETHARFPRRTNVQLAEPDGPHAVRALVWERGAGETPASGSSAVAVAAAAVRGGWARSPVTVRMPGGELLVELDAEGATLVGPAVEICSGSVPSPAGRPGSVVWTDLTVPDADGIRDFYAAVTGWRPHAVDMGGYADWHMLDAAGEAAAGICHARGPNAALPSAWLVYVVTLDLDTAIRRALDLGGELLRAPTTDSRYAVLSDPEGAAFALIDGSAPHPW